MSGATFATRELRGERACSRGVTNSERCVSGGDRQCLNLVRNPGVFLEGLTQNHEHLEYSLSLPRLEVGTFSLTVTGPRLPIQAVNTEVVFELNVCAKRDYT